MRQKNTPKIANPTVSDKGSSTSNNEERNIHGTAGSLGQSLFEIRLNEFVKKDEISEFDLQTVVVRCSACGCQINDLIEKDVRKHQKLNVITCKVCYEFYGSRDFSQDECGLASYCIWCGKYGNPIICNYCPSGFCTACIRRNFGQAEISETTREGWKCYVCDENRLKSRIKFCDLVISFKNKCILKKNNQHQPATSSAKAATSSANVDTCSAKAAISSATVATSSAKAAISSANVATSSAKADTISEKAAISSANVATSSAKAATSSANEATSSAKAVISETWLQSAFDDFDSECKVFCRKMIELRKMKISRKKSLREIIKTMQDLIEDHMTCLKKIIELTILNYVQYIKHQQQAIEPVVVSNENKNSVDYDSDIVELKEDDDENSKEGENSNVPVMERDESNDKISQAKLQLLQSSSGSENGSESKQPAPDSSIKTSSKITSFDDSDDVIEIIDSPDERDNNEKSSLDQGNRKIISSYSDILNLDSENDKHDMSRQVKENNKQSQLSIDQKLKLAPKVDLVRCDYLLGDSMATSVVSRSSNSKATARQQFLESTSSIEVLSSDEVQKMIQQDRKLPLKSKSSKLPAKSDDESTNSSTALDSDSEVYKKKKGLKFRKNIESDTSDDVFPVKKARKYRPLQHGPLISDDDSDSKIWTKGKAVSRKRKVLSSDDNKQSHKSSGTSTVEEIDNITKKTQERKRIKKLQNSSDEEKNKDDSPGKSRKNIHRILPVEKVAITTREAQANEKERKKRIAERQKLYNKKEEIIYKGHDVMIRKKVLEVDPDSKEEIVEIHPNLVRQLKPHQVKGVEFMWESTIESVKDLDKPGSGCILAHCMGLGKTLQVITFLHTCLTNNIVGKVITRAMIICPYNTALNWATEFKHWLRNIEGSITVHQLASVRSNLQRLYILEYWFQEGGVIILSYDMFRRLAADKVPKLRKKEKRQLSEYLLNPGPDIVVFDEGHILKNEKSAISLAANKLATLRRIILTGTPLQNNMKEYHCMINFVKPNLLGTSKEFFNRFVHPITNGQYEDSSEYDVRLMKRRIHVLHKFLDGCVQRCDYSVLTKFLPPKHEFVISVKLSETQTRMYESYLENLTSAKQNSKIVGGTLFADFNNLRNIWTHPYICHTAHKKSEIRRILKNEGSDDEFINDGEVTAPESSFSSSEEVKMKSNSDIGNRKYTSRSRAMKSDDDDSEEDEIEDEFEQNQWYNEFITEADKYNIELSGKMVLLLEILNECDRIGDKVLLFSQSLLALDMIEDILSYSETQSHSQGTEESDKDIFGSWCKGLDYFRMDGTTSVDFRKSYIDMFNDPANERARLFLISTKAGSLGTNLVGANRVILFDTSWNPSHDVQAIFRVYRFGQVKPVYIYRLLAHGTMEEKIYDRQVTKISLSYRVVDEQQIERHFSAADLSELYSFDRNSTKQRPTPLVPNDRLLAELLMRHNGWIATYHEHDSLLQNETETDLTEEERQAAWAEYDNEKEERKTQSSVKKKPLADDFVASNLTDEPDFTKDFERKKIPELKTIVERLFEHIKKSGDFDVENNSLEFKKRLLSSLSSVRQYYQEKHVKVLRQKQKFCNRRSVPSSINKYMEDLSEIIKSCGNYINRLSEGIAAEQTKLQKMQQQSDQGLNQQQAQTLQTTSTDISAASTSAITTINIS